MTFLAETAASHRVIIGDSRHMRELENGSVHLVVTSPPYPMVAIWDDFFAEAEAHNYSQMHTYLDQVWAEVERVLVPGGLACINVGDATRTRDGVFRLYPNHSRIIQAFEKLGLVTLQTFSGRNQQQNLSTREKELFSGPDSSHPTPT